MLATLPLFGLWPSPWTVGLIPILFLAGLFFAAFGLIMTAVAKNYDFFNYFISLVLTPLFLFSGIFFSLKSMAPKARLVFELLPLTPTVNLSRMLTYGQIEGHWLLMIVGSLLLTLIAVGLACLLMNRRLIK